MKLDDRFTLVSIDGVTLTTEQRRFWERWVTNLRNGVYQQGQGFLRQEVSMNQKTGQGIIKHCCLGVLAEMYLEQNTAQLTLVRAPSTTPGKHIWQFKELNPSAETEAAGLTTTIACLPEVVGEALNLSGTGLVCSVIDTHRASECHLMSLAALNDCGVSFAKIADVIEQALNGGYPVKE
jgi:hypothetical protein